MFEMIENGAQIADNVRIGHFVVIKNGAKIGKNTVISDYAYIDSDVVIGENNYIGTGVYIKGCVLIGHDNYISDKTVIGLPSKHIGYHFYKGRVLIGNHNCRIGFGNIPNCSKEYDTIICCDCCLNGFVQLRKGCELGSGTHIREYTSVGEGVYTAMLSHIVKDVPPFAFIRCNRNVGYSEKLREKFDLSKEKIDNLRLAFENKRSGRLKKY